MRVLSSLVFSAMLSLLTGCVGTLDGHSKAAVPMVKDKIAKRFDRSVAQVAEATRAVLADNGKLLSNDVIGNSFSAKIDESSVWVKLNEVEPKLTEVVVQARRRGGAPDIDIAAEVSTQIALKLTTIP